jgi:catechol 2,3-dioxygenase-like lactoylglutathione lyase family enzyme
LTDINVNIQEVVVSRVQLALNVSDLEASIAFYSTLFGVEVDQVAEVEAQAGRLRDAGLAAFDEKDTTCCYALQDKVWVHDPAGVPWEVYTVKDDDPASPRPASASLPLLETSVGDGACCTPASGFAAASGERTA